MAWFVPFTLTMVAAISRIWSVHDLSYIVAQLVNIIVLFKDLSSFYSSQGE